MDEVKSLLNDIRQESDYIFGWVDTQEKLSQFENSFRIVSGVEFAVRSSRKRLSTPGNKFYFDYNSPLPIRLPYPFSCDGVYMIKSCVHAKQYHAPKKKTEEKEEDNDPASFLPANHANHLQKRDCTASMHIREITTYPDYQTDLHRLTKAYHIKLEKQRVTNWLKTDIMKGVPIKTASRFYLRVPLQSAHSHLTNEVTRHAQSIHPKVKLKIIELVSEGITDKSLIRCELEQFVMRDLCADAVQLPNTENRSYFPTKKNIANHVYDACKKVKYSTMDQEELGRRICDWVSDDPSAKFHLRKCASQHDANNETCISKYKWDREYVLDSPSLSTTHDMDATDNDDGDNVDFTSASQNLELSQKRLRSEIDRIKDLSYRCKDIKSINECMKTLHDVRKRLNENT